MKTMLMSTSPWLAAFVIGGALALAPVASAASLADPSTPSHGGYVVSNHDEVNTTNGFVDQAF